MSDQSQGAIVIREDLFQKFDSILAETKLDSNGLMLLLFHLYERSLKKRPVGRPRKNRPSGNKVRETVDDMKVVWQFETLEETRIAVSESTDNQTETENRSSLREKTKTQRARKHINKHIKPSGGREKSDTLDQEDDVDYIPVLKITLPLTNGTPTRRSSRKPKTPKRKLSSSEEKPCEDNIAHVELVPKRRRKNKPQKLIRQTPGSDNDQSDNDTEGDRSVNQSEKNPCGRRSKASAKSAIGNLYEELGNDEDDMNYVSENDVYDDDDDDKEPLMTANGIDSDDEHDEEYVADKLEEREIPGPFENDDETVDENNVVKFKISTKKGKTGKNKNADNSPLKGVTKRKHCRPRGDKSESKSGEKIFKCDKCQAAFNREAHLKRHMKGVHEKEAEFACRLCGKACASELRLKCHESLTCKMAISDYRCGDCGLGFQLKEDQCQHKCSRDPKRPFQCELCPNYKTASSRDLEQHLHSHTGEKRFKCDLCDFSTAWRKNLREHVIKHSGLKPFVCDICGFATNDRHNLRSHRTTHSTKKDFMCELCGVKFREPRFLKAHMITHTDRKPFKCNLCHYSAKFASSLRSHMLTHTDIKKFICEQCGQSFRTSTNMESHKRNVHLYPDKAYHCKECGYTATSSQSINSHMRKHSKKERKPRGSAKAKGAETTEGSNEEKGKSFSNVEIFRCGWDAIDHVEVVESNLNEAQEGLQSDMKQLDSQISTINTQDLHGLPENRHDAHSVGRELFSVVEACGIQPGHSQEQHSQSGTRPQFEELLYNSNTSQADTITAMMSLIREYSHQPHTTSQYFPGQQ